jgi:hypothetical protein
MPNNSGAETLNPPQTRIEAEVLRIRGLMEGSRFEDALRAAQVLLREVPENRDVLYMIAVSQRYLGRIADALATLAHFETLHPGYSICCSAPPGNRRMRKWRLPTSPSSRRCPRRS